MLRLIQLVDQQHGIKLGVVSSWRSVKEQTLNYQKGRTYDTEQGIWVVSNKDEVVTNAKPGTSAHNVVTMQGKPAALAADLMLLTNGTFDWIRDEKFWEPI